MTVNKKLQICAGHCSSLKSRCKVMKEFKKIFSARVFCVAFEETRQLYFYI